MHKTKSFLAIKFLINLRLYQTFHPLKATEECGVLVKVGLDHIAKSQIQWSGFGRGVEGLRKMTVSKFKEFYWNRKHCYYRSIVLLILIRALYFKKEIYIMSK